MRVQWKKRVSWLRLPLVVVIILCLVLLSGGGYVLARIGGVGRNASATDIELQKGLVGWWKMDGNAKDASPYRAHGTVTGATLSTDREGKANSAYSYATNDSVFAPYNAAQDITGDLTLSAWIYPTTFAGYSNNWADIIHKRTLYGSETEPYSMMLTNDGRIMVAWKMVSGGDVNGYGSLQTAPSSIILNNWQHVVITRAASLTSIYINGVLSISDANGYAPSGAVGNSIGVNIGGPTGQFGSFPGKLDDVRIYNRVLSASEAAALTKGYNSGVASNSGEKGLLGHWDFDGNAFDGSPNRRHGTVSNATLTTDRKGKVDGAYSFNGSSAYISAPALGITSNTVTYAAWIYPVGGQGAYDGIIYCRNCSSGSQPTGMTYDATGTKISYAWNAGDAATWMWDSGLTIPTGQWSLVVLAIEPTRATAYLGTGGSISSAANVIAHSAQSLDASFMIGNDTLGGRFFGGSMDDIRIYNRTLSSAEVTSLYSQYNSQVSVADTQKGLTGDWSLNGNAKDATPNRNHGVITAATLTTDRKGRANSAYSFNGTTSYITVPDSTAFTFGANPVTVTAWVKFNSGGMGSYQFIASQSIASFEINKSNTNKLRMEMTYANSTYKRAEETTASLTSSGVWYFVAGVFTPSTGAFQLYTNGQSRSVSYVDAQGGGTLMDSASTVTFGARNSTNINFNGDLDDVRIWKRALSAAEISQLYATYR